MRPVLVERRENAAWNMRRMVVYLFRPFVITFAAFIV